MSIIKDIKLLKTSVAKKDDNSAKFVFDHLSPGYGITIGHALRRVLLSSLKGTAITSVKFDKVTHEFSTIKGVKEDVTNIILNLKHLTLKSHSDEPVKLKLSKKGPGKILAKDFKKNSQVDVLDPNYYIATLEKDGKIDMEVTVEQGFGYVPVEKRQDKKLNLGTIAIDAIFNPVKKINYTVENSRVGSATNYNKLTLNITTNNTIKPEEALKKSINILEDYFSELLPSKSAKTNRKTSIKKKKSKKTKSSKKK